MDIPNLSQQPPASSNKKAVTISLVIIIIALSTATGFWLSRLLPQNSSSNSPLFTSGEAKPLSADKISDKDQIKAGAVYGNQNSTFADTATGVIESGGVNGEGTHTLIREGGEDQKAALTSSVLDLELFVNRQVEIKGETNSSTKAGWFLDVGMVKVLE